MASSACVRHGPDRCSSHRIGAMAAALGGVIVRRPIAILVHQDVVVVATPALAFEQAREAVRHRHGALARTSLDIAIRGFCERHDEFCRLVRMAPGTV